MDIFLTGGSNNHNDSYTSRNGFKQELLIIHISLEIKNFIEKGRILVREGKYDEALKFFEKALELDPHDHRTWNLKGMALRSIGRYNEAIECFNKSLELVPKDLDAS